MHLECLISSRNVRLPEIDDQGLKERCCEQDQDEAEDVPVVDPSVSVGFGIALVNHVPHPDEAG